MPTGPHRARSKGECNMQKKRKSFTVVGSKPTGIALHSANHSVTLATAFAWK